MKRAVIFTLFLVVLYGCTYDSTTIYYSKKETDFNKFRTFAWVHGEDKICKGNKIKEEAFHYVNMGFIVRGYQLDTVAPDLLLDMQMLDENRMSGAKCLGYCPTTEYIMYFYPTNEYKFSLVNSSKYPYSPWQYELDTLMYQNQSLGRIITLNVIDPKKGKTVWSATALANSQNDKKLAEAIHSTVRTVMKSFPVKIHLKQNEMLTFDYRMGRKRN